MIYILTLLIFVTGFLLTYLLMNLLLKRRKIVESRLIQIKDKKKNKSEYEELNLPFYHRVIKPIGDKLSDTISNITPGGMKAKINEKLTTAGNPMGMAASQWILIKIIFFLLVTGGAVTTVVFIRKPLSNMILILGISVIIAYMLPKLILVQITKRRKEDIIKALPDVLDLLTVSVEAGLGFDGAISRLVDKIEGPVSKEFGRVLNEIRMGRSRRESLKEMSERCKVMDLTTFVGAIVQADELGVGIGNVLRIQSKQMRQKRRQRAQEKAMKAPIKMLFPLVLFIFPTIFSVLLGPALIKIMNEFIH